MKRLCLLFVCMLNILWASAQFNGSGTGTSSDPYKIYNPDQLSQVRNFLSTPGVCFKLMNNIDLGDWISENYPSQGWQPIGSNNAAFQGVFDGNGKSITNFSINRSSASYVGFFGYTDGATIKDLTITGTTVKGGQYTGSLIGYGKSTIISNYTYSGNVTCSSYGGGVAGYISGGSVSTLTVTSTVTGTASYVGGLFGVAGGQTVTKATFTGSVNGSGYLGGAIGQVANGELTLTSCTINAPVTGTNDYVGGIIGQSTNSTNLSSCSQLGSLKGKSNMGGIGGYASGTTTFTNCEHTGDINAGGSNIGGVLGYNNSGTLTIDGCNTTGDIKNGTNNVGGVLGYTQSTSTVKNCKHVGHMTGTYNMGGTVGFVDGCKITVDGCHSDGNITGTSQGCIGGVCGLLKNASSSTITGSSSWGDISGGTCLGGVVGYIQKTDITSSIDLTSTIVSSEHTRKHQVNGYVKRAQYDYPNSYVRSVIYHFYFRGDTCYAWDDQLVSRTVSNKLLTSTEPAYKAEGLNVAIDNTVKTSEGYYEYFDVYKNYEITLIPNFIQYESATDSQSPIHPFYAGDGKFYKNRLEQSMTLESETNILNCSSVGNIVSSNHNNYVGGIVGKDECAISSYVKTSSDTYYYYPYDPVLEDVSLQFYNARYKAKYPKMESVVLSTYTKTFDITKIEGSYFSGSINGGNYVGGIVGYKVSGSVNRNYSNATITGSDYVGGLAGKLAKNTSETSSTSFDANVALNPRVSATGSNVGRVYGSKDANFSIAALGTNYENRVLATSILSKNGAVQSVSDDLQNGTAVGISQLRYKSNYVAWGWDFNNNWTILETESFPYKVWQTAPPTFNGKITTGATSVSGKSVDGGTVTVITTDANKTYTTAAPNNTWTVTLNTGLHTNEEVKAYAQKTGLQKSYMSSTMAGQLGSGTPEDPYLIYTAYDLAGITKEGNYKVMNDIDLTSWINENSPTTGWVAVGVSVSDSLVIEGDGHKISGLWSKPTSLSEYAGLFSMISGSSSVIRNLTLENVNIQGGNKYTAGLIGKFGGGLYNCHVTGNVKGAVAIGMLAAQNYGVVSNCTAEGAVSTNSGSFVGGLIGTHYGTDITDCSANVNISVASSSSGASIGVLCGQTHNITNCTAKGIISGNVQGTSSKAGGITGSGSTIMNCSSEVTISGIKGSVGGIAGTCKNVTDCKADVTIESGNKTGGIIGECSGNISRSFSNGSVTGETYAGGIAGYAKGAITNCYSTANVTTSGTESTSYAGGLVGYLTSTLTNSYATGDVASSGLAAGVVCYLDGTGASVNNCTAVNNKVAANSTSGYAMRVIGGYTNGAADPEQTCLAYKDMAVSINNVPQRVYDDPLQGTSTTIEALNTQSTYTGLGWDFSSVWYMNATTGLPDFQWNNTKAEQTLTINPEIASMTYGGDAVALPTQTDQGLSITWTSSNTNVATISGHTIISRGAGNTIISYSQAGNDTYLELSGSFSFSVNKAPLTITADNKSRQEGTANPELTVSYSGFVNGDDENSLSQKPTVTTTANTTSSVGTYPIIVSGAVSSNYEITYVEGTLTVVKDYTMGDVNGDGRINGLDIVEMVDKILDRPTTGTFVFAAADFDANGVINGMDLVEEVSLVLSQTASGVKARKAPEKFNPDMASMMRMSKTHDGSISVGIDSADDYILSQFVLELSDGQQLKDIAAADRDHVIAFQQIDGNRYMVLCYSTRNAAFTDNNDLLRISCEGEGTVKVTDVMMVDADRKPHYVRDTEFGEATGIEIVNGSFVKPADIYSVSGSLVRKNAKSTRGLGKGIYVVNGKTIIIK